MVGHVQRNDCREQTFSVFLVDSQQEAFNSRSLSGLPSGFEFVAKAVNFQTG